VLAAAAMDRWLAKLIGVVLVFVLPFAFTVLPHHMKRCMERHGTRGRRILCLFMCFGGGIFLATYLLHMGPEVCPSSQGRIKHLVGPTHFTMPGPQSLC